ncbi:hypothetical protein BDZ91DRAFT_770467 [Kalaharituber pfeilii]|nr:hypothetical protein BDZ91DRAFT_770467 [Kalaharituber pfeilii]
MPTQLEELVGFLGSPSPHIKQIALDNLVGYSAHQPVIFKPEGLKPIEDLKALVGASPHNSKNALTVLVNLSSDPSVLALLVNDPEFVELLMSRITDLTFSGADLVAMLLANMAKHDSFPATILSLKRKVSTGPAGKGEGVSSSTSAMDQLMDCFVKGSGKRLNKEANFDYLSYFFADVSRAPQGRKYFITRQAYDDVIPISKLIVFTEHESDLRRQGVASTIKNACFEVSAHPSFLAEDEINLLPYILLPLMGPEEYFEEETNSLPLDLQFLPPTKRRDPSSVILTTHLESLLLLATTRSAREHMRKMGVYPVLREAHLAVDDDEVREAVDRVVQVLMAEEDPGDPDPELKVRELRTMEEEEEDDSEDDKVVEII